MSSLETQAWRPLLTVSLTSVFVAPYADWPFYLVSRGLLYMAYLDGCRRKLHACQG